MRARTICRTTRLYSSSFPLSRPCAIKTRIERWTHTVSKSVHSRQWRWRRTRDSLVFLFYSLRSFFFVLQIKDVTASRRILVYRIQEKQIVFFICHLGIEGFRYTEKLSIHSFHISSCVTFMCSRKLVAVQRCKILSGFLLKDHKICVPDHKLLEEKKSFETWLNLLFVSIIRFMNMGWPKVYKKWLEHSPDCQANTDGRVN